MKTKLIFMLSVSVLIFGFGCDSVSYKKTSHGMAYKVISGKGKDSIGKIGNIVKFHYESKLNDSLLYSSYGKVPAYVQLSPQSVDAYSPIEALLLVRKGDSLITITIVDTLINKGLSFQLPPGAKKGDRIITSMRILEIYPNDSIARPDYEAELEKDKPRQEAEMKEMQAKAEEEKKQQAINGDKEVADYLKKNNITAQKAPGGTYVVVEKKGDGEPVVSGKFLAIKYTGRSMQTGNEFESNVYKFQVGTRNVIEGWDDGLLLFNKGGKGVLYIPGYLAYGAQQGPGGTTWESLIFDVEVLAVGNTQEEVDSVNTPQ